MLFYLQVTMLVPVIRKHITYNLQRIITCVTYKNKSKIRSARHCSESDLLSVPLLNFAAARIYSTKPDSQTENFLPMLMDGASTYGPTILTPLKLFYLSIFKIIPHIDQEFNIHEFLKGAKYATTIISKALANKDFKALDGLVSEDMIETLRTKIETLTPNQRQLIALNEEDMLFFIFSNIDATNDNEQSIDITITCHYIQNLKEKKDKVYAFGFKKLPKSMELLVCNYIFTRKYNNNVGGPWIATFINHYTMQ